MSTPEIYISDHCIIRYFERHFGVDIEDIKKQRSPK